MSNPVSVVDLDQSAAQFLADHALLLTQKANRQTNIVPADSSDRVIAEWMNLVDDFMIEVVGRLAQAASTFEEDLVFGVGNGPLYHDYIKDPNDEVELRFVNAADSLPDWGLEYGADENLDFVRYDNLGVEIDRPVQLDLTTGDVAIANKLDIGADAKLYYEPAFPGLVVRNAADSAYMDLYANDLVSNGNVVIKSGSVLVNNSGSAAADAAADDLVMGSTAVDVQNGATIMAPSTSTLRRHWAFGTELSDLDAGIGWQPNSGSTGSLYVRWGGVDRLQGNGTSFFPVSAGGLALGSTGLYFSSIYSDVFRSGNGTGGGSGRTATFQAGVGDGAGTGGSANLYGGTGGSSGNGGTVNITGGTPGATAGVGGNVNITGGTATAPGYQGGNVTVRGGTPTDHTGGACTVGGGDAAGTNRSGGGTSIVAGDATGSGAGGSVTIEPGTSPSGTVGTVNINDHAGVEMARFNNAGLIIRPNGDTLILGNPDASAVSMRKYPSTTTAGGTLTIRAGDTSFAGGAGGLTAISGGLPADGAGGAVSVSGADGAGTNRAGGIASLSGGDATGTAQGGDVAIQPGASPSGTDGVTIMRDADGTEVVRIKTGSFQLGGGIGSSDNTCGNSADGNAFLMRGATYTSGNGRNMIWRGGQGGATNQGGEGRIEGGVGGGTSGKGGTGRVLGGTPVDGDGGDVLVEARDGAGTNRNGGAASVLGGDATGTGTGGDVTLQPGTGGTVGEINLNDSAGVQVCRVHSGGLSIGVNSTAVVIGAADANEVIVTKASTSTTNGGTATLRGGVTTLTNGQGGQAKLQGGTGNGTGVGGQALVQGGTPGATGIGGIARLAGGPGGATSGDGGQVQIAGGTATEGNGGLVAIFAGQAGTVSAANHPGGSVTIDAGDGIGAGSGGHITITSGDSPSGSPGEITVTTPAGFTFKMLSTGHLLFPVFTDGNRGGTGTAGRVIFNSTDGNLNIDDGTNWILPDGTTT